MTALKDGFADARHLAEARRAVSADPLRRAEVALYHDDLRSLLKRRRARQWLDANAPGSVGLPRDEIHRWRSFWDRWNELQTLVEGLPGDLRTDPPATYEPELVADLIRRADRTAELGEAVRAAGQLARQSRLILPLERLVAVNAAADFETEISAWRSALVALDANRLGEAAKHAEELAFGRERIARLDQLLDEQDYKLAEKELVELELAASALGPIAERYAIINGPTGKLQTSWHEVEAAALANADPPRFMADLNLALTTHQKVVRLEEIRSGKSSRAVADKLCQLRDQVLDDARRLLGLRIQDRIVRGFRSPRFLSSLDAFKKAVRAAAKRFERIEALKNSDDFDINILTEVFPCWIMRPEDACRVFPLQPELFDVVIFDEASQCNPDQALPLFARAKRIAIFGDNKQLSNEDLRRSLAGAANEALIHQSGLDELDRARLFDQTQNSLLDLISARAQATIVLNEHFRCRPEIIAFSNNAFYGNALRIMRDRDDDRGLGPPFLIREVTGVPPLGKTKVNPHEATMVVDELKRCLDDPRYDGLSFGILSLFRDQIERIEDLVKARVPREQRDRHRLICSTVDGFQGDERDVIFYSWRFSATSSPSILSFTNGETGSQRVNVALTRARHQAIHFISAPVERFPQGSRNVTGFLQHAKQPEFLMANVAARIHHEPRDTMRSRVVSTLTDAGFQIEERFIAGGISIDIKVTDPETGARVALFVDSKLDPHPPATTVRRVDGHGLLERAGWRVLRLSATDVADQQFVVKLVRDAVDEAAPRRVMDGESAAYQTLSAVAEPEGELDEAWVPGEIAAEDRADYHWPVPSVEERLRAGEDVFESDFERLLYDSLAVDTGVHVVPQWPSRGKRIDLVITDREGRRLALEADGDHYHVTDEGSLIPEDINRQELLEAAGWVFHRVRHSDFASDADAQVSTVFEVLAAQAPNPALAKKVWAETLDPAQIISLDTPEVDDAARSALVSLEQGQSPVPTARTPALPEPSASDQARPATPEPGLDE